MKEENIDKRIERMIESVAAKKASMRQWEGGRKIYKLQSAMQRKQLLRRRIRRISVAAAIAVVAAIGIALFVPHRGKEKLIINPGYECSSPAPVFRGTPADVDGIPSRIENEEYAAALEAIDSALADTIIDPSFTAERQEYLRSVNANREYELKWSKINILLKMNKKAEAISLLKEYAKSPGKHQKEAKALLHQLQ